MPAAGGFYGLSDAICLVSRQVVQDDDVAGREGRHENLLDIGPESHSIHRPSRTIGAVMPESLSAPVNVVVFQ